MTKYKLDDELRLLSHFRFPLSRSLAGPVQSILRAWPHMGDRRVKVKKLCLPGPDGNRIPTYLVTPKGAESPLPCLYYIHGGGFYFPPAPYHIPLAKEYAEGANCAIVFPDYRLAPQHPFPAAPEDCFAVYQWLLREADTLGIDGDRIAVGGDSAGGNLAAVTTLMARDRAAKMPVFQLLIYPVTDRRMETESSKRFRDAPIWNTAASEKMWAFYLPTLPEEHLEYASPLEADSLAGLPDAYLEVAEFDSLRDEGLLYGRRLEEAGARVEYYKTQGTPHGFELMYSAAVTRKAVAKRIEALKAAFAKA